MSLHIIVFFKNSEATFGLILSDKKKSELAFLRVELPHAAELIKKLTSRPAGIAQWLSMYL